MLVQVGAYSGMRIGSKTKQTLEHVLHIKLPEIIKNKELVYNLKVI